MRERRLLCCSNREPLGTNGFGLFIDLALIASFLRGWLIFSAAKIFRRQISRRGFKFILFIGDGLKASQNFKPAGETNTPPAIARLATSRQSY